MQAVVFDGQALKVDPHYPDPTPREGEVVVRPLLAGISSLDLDACLGQTPFLGVLGHEFVGIVDAVGPKTGERGKKLLGQRVVGSPNCKCGLCDMCTSGLSEHCRQRTVLGLAGRNGCFAEQFTLPVTNLYPVPKYVDDDRALFATPLSVACVTRQRLHMHIENQPYVTVLGDGLLGLLTAQVLARSNASVRVLGKHPEKVALCEKWGIKHRLTSEIMPRADQDILIDCTGSVEGLAMAMRMVRPRGKIVLNTAFTHPTEVDLSPLVLNEIEVIGSRSGTMPDALSLLAEDAVDVVSLISRRVRFSQAREAMRLAQQEDVIKVVLEMT